MHVAPGQPMGPFSLVFLLGRDVRNSVSHKREGPAYSTHARHTDPPDNKEKYWRPAGSQMQRIHDSCTRAN